MTPDYAKGRADALKEAMTIAIVHPTKLSNQIISTIKDATEHIGSLAQQPQTEPERTCGTCRYGDPLPSRCDLYWHNNCGNSEVGFPHHQPWQPKEGA